MIKLTTILSEIKIIGKITPEMVDNLFWSVLEGHANRIKKVEEINKALADWNNQDKDWDEWIYIQSPKRLRQLYNDLSNIKNAYSTNS